MTITVNGNKIIFDNYALEFSPSGISANGNFIFAQGQPLAFGEFQGTNAGYVIYGRPLGTTTLLNIDRFPFGNAANATDAGDLVPGWSEAAGHSSDIAGYATRDNIFKFPFSTNAGTISNVGTTGLSATQSMNGHSTATHGYITSGWFPAQNRIERFPFATDGPVKNVGRLALSPYISTPVQSEINGYNMGGGGVTIDKFPFATEINSVNLGNLLPTYTNRAAGISSSTHGYACGGNSPAGAPSAVNKIEKFPFATEGPASNVASLTVLRQWMLSGISSRDFGYLSGGQPPPPSNEINTIERFPFANETSIADIADLTQGKSTGQGIQD